MEEEDVSRCDTSCSSSSSSRSSDEESSEGEELERSAATPRPSIYNISEVVDGEKILMLVK